MLQKLRRTFQLDGRDNPAVALGEEPDRAVCRPTRDHGLFGAQLPLSVPRAAEGGVAENVSEHIVQEFPVQRCLLRLVEGSAAQLFEPDRDGLLMSPIQRLVKGGHPGAHQPRMKQRKVMFAHTQTCITQTARRAIDFAICSGANTGSVPSGCHDFDPLPPGSAARVPVC